MRGDPEEVNKLAERVREGSIVGDAVRAVPPRMKCGHTTNATRQDTGQPVCVICIGIRPGATEVDPDPPSLEGRTMVCAQCRREAPSDAGAAFFEHRPDRATDSFYDGCRGWD